METVVRLTVVPLELDEANQFIKRYHRHHDRSQGHRFSLGVIDNAFVLHGCAVIGRPVSGVDPRRVIEVTRLCSDGAKNACSMLYGAAARAAQAMGYERIQTYIFASEDGGSLRASGWTFDRMAHPSGRHHKRTDGESRDTTHVATEKALWYRTLVTASALPRHPKQIGGIKDLIRTVNQFDVVEETAQQSLFETTCS